MSEQSQRNEAKRDAANLRAKAVSLAIEIQETRKLSVPLDVVLNDAEVIHGFLKGKRV